MDSIGLLLASDTEFAEVLKAIGRALSWVAGNLPVCLVVLTVAGPLFARLVKGFKATQAQAGKDRLAEWLVTQVQARAPKRVPGVTAGPPVAPPTSMPPTVPRNPRPSPAQRGGTRTEGRQEGRSAGVSNVRGAPRPSGSNERPTKRVDRVRGLRRAIVLGEALSQPRWSRL